MSWTDERVELLRQLWLDGRSASQISAQLGHGVTRNAVIGKVHRLGLAGRAKAPSVSGVAAARRLSAAHVAASRLEQRPHRGARRDRAGARQPSRRSTPGRCSRRRTSSSRCRSG